MARTSGQSSPHSGLVWSPGPRADGSAGMRPAYGRRPDGPGMVVSVDGSGRWRRPSVTRPVRSASPARRSPSWSPGRPASSASGGAWWPRAAWRGAAGVPPEPADPPGRRPPGRGGDLPAVVQQPGDPARLRAVRGRRRGTGPATPAGSGSATTASSPPTGAARAPRPRRQGRSGCPAPSGPGATRAPRCPTGRWTRTTGGPTTPGTRRPTTSGSHAGRPPRTGGPAGRRTCRPSGGSTARWRWWTTTCRPGCTAPAASGWPGSRLTPPAAGGSSCTSEAGRRGPDDRRVRGDAAAEDALAAALARPGGGAGRGDGPAVGDQPDVSSRGART